MIPKFPKPGKKKKKPLPKVILKEADLQELAEQYLEARNIKYFRIPDALYGAIFANNFATPYQKREISAYLKGYPDLTIFHPSKYRKGIYPSVLPLELKTEAGKMSQGQKAWQRDIGTIEAKGWDEIKTEIDKFLDD